jgi:hypothetical protein
MKAAPVRSSTWRRSYFSGRPDENQAMDTFDKNGWFELSKSAYLVGVIILPVLINNP